MDRDEDDGSGGSGGIESRVTMAKRFPFLDWMRGLALVIMIQCHVFNSFARMDVRNEGSMRWRNSPADGGSIVLFMAG